MKKKLNEIAQEIEDEVEQRDLEFDYRTIKWQQSEKGELYMDKTGDLESLLSSIADAQKYLADYLN